MISVWVISDYHVDSFKDFVNNMNKVKITLSAKTSDKCARIMDSSEHEQIAAPSKHENI